MGHIRKQQGTRGTTFQACWRDPSGRQRTMTFPTKALASSYLKQVDVDLHTGSYVDPTGPRTTVAEWLELWLPTQAGRTEATRAKNATLYAIHVLPRWGEQQLGAITTTEVQAWVAQLSTQYAPETVRGIHSRLSGVLGAAVRARLIPSNPAQLQRGDLPAVRRRKLTYLDAAELGRLVLAAPDRYAALIHLTAWTGMRWGEVTALRWEDVELHAKDAPGYVHVRRAVVDVKGRITIGPPKTAGSVRSIVIDADTAAALEKHRASYGDDDRAHGGLLFTAQQGGVLRGNHFHQRAWKQTREAAGVPHAHFHDLRHSHASVMIAAGMNILTLSRRLGHSSPAMTLDRYGHLQRDHVDATLEAIRRATG